MKNLGVSIAIVVVGVAGAATAAERMTLCGQTPFGAELAGPAPRNLAYPSFCDIPPAPKSVRSATTFKTEVVDVRVAGRDLDAQTGPGSWSLSDTEAFAAGALGEAQPPPPMSPPSPGGVEAFVKESQALATPPPRHHRHHP